VHAQTYDGAGNMAGEHMHCQKLILDIQRLATAQPRSPI